MNANPIKRFRRFLKDRRQRLTGARLRIAVTVFALPGSTEFAADDLANALEAVSRATVYRTLTLLVDAGLIRRDMSGDGRQVFSHVFATTSGDWAASVLLATKYTDLCAASHRSLIVGRCPWCGQTIIYGRPSSDST